MEMGQLYLDSQKAFFEEFREASPDTKKQPWGFHDDTPRIYAPASYQVDEFI